jgi:undecaprenyl-diphosphatase
VQGLLKFDHVVFRAINNGWHSTWLDPVFLVLSYTGLGQIQFVLALFLLLSKELKYMVMPLLANILASGVVVTQLSKHLLDRDRPSNLWYAIAQEDWHSHSFPSGHTTTSFSVAVTLLLMTRGSKREWIGWSSLVWASMVGVSRIYRGVHWPTDVLGGACAGAFTACLIYAVWGKNLVPQA